MVRPVCRRSRRRGGLYKRSSFTLPGRPQADNPLPATKFQRAVISVNETGIAAFFIVRNEKEMYTQGETFRLSSKQNLESHTKRRITFVVGCANPTGLIVIVRLIILISHRKPIQV